MSVPMESQVYALVFGNFNDMIREQSNGAIMARADTKLLLRYLQFSEMTPEARHRVSWYYSVMRTALEEGAWQQVCENARTHTFARIHTCICTQTHARAHTHAHAHTHTHAHARTRTHTHARTHARTHA